MADKFQAQQEAAEAGSNFLAFVYFCVCVCVFCVCVCVTCLCLCLCVCVYMCVCVPVQTGVIACLVRIAMYRVLQGFGVYFRGLRFGVSRIPGFGVF